MNVQYIGKQSIRFDVSPHIIAGGSVAGTKEKEGPLGNTFDKIIDDPMCGKDSWEEAESELQYQAAHEAMKKAGLDEKNIRYVFAGDLLGQLMATSFGLASLNIPLFGLFGACSTMGESLCAASMTIAGGFADTVLAVTSSHFASAEKTFRFPLGYGTQRKKSATWTVTGSGAVILSDKGGFARITGITPGRIIDMGVTDKENMGAVMAPAAADTIYNHFMDFNSKPEDYDRIITGDLGYVGQRILFDMLKEKGYDISKVHMDCGIEIYDSATQDTHAGGSGCGCSAVVLCGQIFKELKNKKLKKILFVPTGALLSPASSNEGMNIPAIAHGVIIQS